MQPNLILPKNATQIIINGPVGKLDCLELNQFTPDILGIGIIFHPDPKGGGTYTNKIVQMIAKVLCNRGYLCICPNLRGVGTSDGVHDMGIGEVEDGLSILSYAKNKYGSNLPIILAGFSFGTSIASKIAIKTEHKKLILIGPAVTKYDVPVPDNKSTLVIYGEHDEIVSPQLIWEWSRKNDVPITWFPNTGHFFHGKLSLLQSVLNNYIL